MKKLNPFTPFIVLLKTLVLLCLTGSLGLLMMETPELWASDRSDTRIVTVVFLVLLVTLLGATVWSFWIMHANKKRDF